MHSINNDSMPRSAIIFGATGMVGSEVLHQCLDNDHFESVIAIGRRPTGISHPKLKEIGHKNFLDCSALEQVLSDADVCFYCLGVYQAQVNKQQFWQITVDYLQALLNTLKLVNKDITFCLFSAQGADPKEKSPFLFARAKGRAEKLLMASSLKNQYIFRPGFIAPGRKSPDFMFSMMLFTPIYKLLPRIGIDAPDLAKVMVHVGITGNETAVLENGHMRTLSKIL